VHSQIEEATPAVDLAKFVLEDLQDMLVREDRPRVLDREQRKRRVVKGPVPRELDPALGAVGHLVTVGVDMIQERGIVEESMLVQKVEKVFTNFACWRAIAFGGHADRALERFKALLHLLGFPVGRIARPAMRVTVMPDLMSGPDDHLNPASMVLGGPAGDKEGAREAGLLERVQDFGDADIGAVPPLAQDAEAPRILWIARRSEGLCIEVERQHDRNTIAVRPFHAHVKHACSPALLPR